MRKIYTLIVLLAVATVAAWGQNPEIEARLQSHLLALTDPVLKGRQAGSDGEKKAAEYIYKQLNDFGVVMYDDQNGQTFSISAVAGDTIHSRNIVGVIEGYDSTLKNEYVVIGANIDNVGSNVLTINGKPTLQIFPGADANATGVACLIEVAQRIASSSFLFRRSVVVAAFGAKEQGMAGSWYFANRAFPYMKEVSIMVDLNMLGRLGPNNYFTYYTCIPNPDINAAVTGTSNDVGFITPDYGTGQMISSDYLAFYEKNIPVTLFTTGMHRDYHTVNDIEEYIDYESMERICEYIYTFVRNVANMDSKVAVPVTSDISGNKEDNVYSVYDVDKAPEFFHGDQRTFLERWVYDYLKYPDAPLTMGIQGQVMVEFIVEKDGSVTNVKVTKSVDEDLDAEAVRVVAASPKWKAGVKGGQKVRVKISIPIEFRLKRR